MSLLVFGLVEGQKCQLKLRVAPTSILNNWNDAKSFCESQGGAGSRLATWQEYCPKGGNSQSNVHVSGPSAGVDNRIAPAYFNNGGPTLQPNAWASLNSCALGLGNFFDTPPLTAEIADVIYCNVCPGEPITPTTLEARDEAVPLVPDQVPSSASSSSEPVVPSHPNIFGRKLRGGHVV
jgi:hypothetical protein